MREKVQSIYNLHQRKYLFCLTKHLQSCDLITQKDASLNFYCIKRIPNVKRDQITNLQVHKWIAEKFSIIIKIHIIYLELKRSFEFICEFWLTCVCKKLLIWYTLTLSSTILLLVVFLFTKGKLVFSWPFLQFHPNLHLSVIFAHFTLELPALMLLSKISMSLSSVDVSKTLTSK